MLLSKMTKDERSLLLYLETCAVDYGGRVNFQRMNKEDLIIIAKWSTQKIIEYGQIAFEYCNNDGSNWVKLTPEMMILAHEERTARAKRMWDKKYFKTTEELRE